MVNQFVNGSMRRESFEKDITAIASVASKHFNDFANGVLEERSKLPAPVQTALRNLMFSTAITPLTDGHKQRLRHTGHNQNIIWGPLQTFSTHNFADSYSALLKMLCTGNFELPQDEEPVMPTLQEMHRMAAASPASTASLWLLKQELAYRHFYGMDSMHIGKLFVPTLPSKYMREDHLASSGAPGLGGFGESSLTPGEAQARVFEHGHDRKTSISKSHDVQQTLLKRACEMQRHEPCDPASSVASPRANEAQAATFCCHSLELPFACV